ncbi:hypothetical protein H477_0440 [[Clostridium] sordellii ATCC 9714]|nr:hypothetical protein H477_0440 [[Clostridium] sordellii ATCC 9714] [Paeniclostridium sordellii ATCC 9714]
MRGAYETLKIAKIYNCKEAILKEGSPSCGCNKIYDGTFSNRKIDGSGITAMMLKKKVLILSVRKNWKYRQILEKKYNLFYHKVL